MRQHTQPTNSCAEHTPPGRFRVWRRSGLRHLKPVGDHSHL